jgi:protein-tyrosine phosphatase
MWIKGEEMIDLHCHILHEMDDGAESAAESIQMAQAFVRTGFRIVAATPHMVPGTSWMPPVERITTQVSYLNQAIQIARLKLEIVPGMEIALDPNIPELLDAGRLLPLGSSSCLLIEPPFRQVPPKWEQVIFSIQARGYSVILAHPERCGQLAGNLALIGKLIDSGVYLQVNLGSFLGQYGHAVRRTVKLLARNGWIHCLATDSHHPTWLESKRMQSAMSKLEKLIGLQNLQRITVDNPLRVLQDKPPRPMKIADSTGGRNRKNRWRFWKAERKCETVL